MTILSEVEGNWTDASNLRAFLQIAAKTVQSKHERPY